MRNNAIYRKVSESRLSLLGSGILRLMSYGMSERAPLNRCALEENAKIETGALRSHPASKKPHPKNRGYGCE